MKMGISVFAYNRDKHLEKTLNGLRQNVEVNELYIFQDGLKSEEDRQGWENTRKIIKDIDWCKVNFFLSDTNKGLAHSIVDGVNFVLEENDTIIVLEDDCVPSNNFVSFMLQCFSQYEENKNVYSISGYSWPINIKNDGRYDVYFNGRFSSWGWGTWKDRWKYYKIDNNILDRIKNESGKSKELAIWGKDIEKMFWDRLSKKNDSWAVYWTLIIIEMGGLCITPFHSFIQNIGNDGSGVHCGKSEKYNVILEQGEKRSFTFPKRLEILDTTKEAFVPFLGNYTGINYDIRKEHILVYGLGNFFVQYEKEINQKYYIEAFIDREKQGFFAGKEIIRAENILKYYYSKILIMIRDEKENIKIKKMLVKNLKISDEKIVLGYKMFP